MAKLYFHYSTMNAGKSTMLLQAAYNYQERGMRTAAFIAALDDRAGRGKIASRIGLTMDAIPFEATDDLYAMVEGMHADEPLACVFLDEAQFLSREQVWQLAHIVDRLGLPVMAYGLRTDFHGRLFPGSQELLTIADELREVRTQGDNGGATGFGWGSGARRRPDRDRRWQQICLAMPPSLGRGDIGRVTWSCLSIVWQAFLKQPIVRLTGMTDREEG